MAKAGSKTALDLSDEDNHGPKTNEQSSTETRIDALDYLSSDHPLLPPTRARSANSVMTIKNRFQFHPEFWWDVFLTMQKWICVRPDLQDGAEALG